jgi:Fe-S cluster biogenesis protein NfuA
MSDDINYDKEIKKALDKVRPQLKADGGDVEYVGFNEKTGVLQVKLLGMCMGCPMAQITLNEGILKTVQEEVVEVKKVEQV